MKKVCAKHELAYEASEGCTYCRGALEDMLRADDLKIVKQCTSKTFEEADDEDTQPIRRGAGGKYTSMNPCAEIPIMDEASFADMFGDDDIDSMPLVGYDANGMYDGFDDIQVKVIDWPSRTLSVTVKW